MKLSAHRNVVLGLMALGVVGVVAPQIGAAKPPQEKAAAPDSNPAKLKALLNERYNLLLQIQSDCSRRYAAGQATEEEIQNAAIAVMKADLEREHTRAERIAIRQKWVATAHELEKIAQKRFEMGIGGRTDLNTAQLVRVEAEIALEREQMGKR